MKKYILILSVLLLAVPAFAQNTVDAPFSATASFCGWTNNQFSSIGGVFSLGAQFGVDADRHLAGRISYRRVNFGPAPLHSVDLSAIEYWYIGGKWRVYFNPGLAIGVADGTGNDLFFAGGVDYPFFIAKTDEKFPFSINGYADLGFFDNATQITAGLRFTKPQR